MRHIFHALPPPKFVAQRERTLCIVDGRLDLSPVPNNPGVSKESFDTAAIKASDLLKLEVGKRGAKVLALVQYGQPTEPGLKPFEAELFKDPAIIASWEPPLLIVVRLVQRGACPKASSDSIGAPNDVICHGLETTKRISYSLSLAIDTQFSDESERQPSEARLGLGGIHAAKGLTVRPSQRQMLMVGLLLTANAAACSSESSSPDASTAIIDAGTTADAAAESVDAQVSNFKYDEQGCLLYSSASQLCGFNSDEAVCTYWHDRCGENNDIGQCKIDCEMGATVECYKEADVLCLLNAVEAQDCVAMEACGWII